MKKADKKAVNIVCDFFAKQEKFRAIEKKYNALKTDFYAAMKEVFDDEENTAVFETVAESFVVKKVQKVSVDFNAKKLQKRLKNFGLDKQIICKRYIINDTDGFVAYLKECGCNPCVLRDFMQTELFVDKKALDRFYDIGELSKEDIAGCYVVRVSEPYFTVKRERDGYGEVE